MRAGRSSLPALWRSVPGVQWRLLHLTQPTFMVGVSALLRTGDGQILLVHNAFWPTGMQWGVPTGYLKPDEPLVRCVNRELREEIGGGAVDSVRVLDVRAGYRLRVEVLLEGTVRDLPEPGAHESFEVEGYRLVTMDSLPKDLHRGHREMLTRHLG